MRATYGRLDLRGGCRELRPRLPRLQPGRPGPLAAAAHGDPRVSRRRAQGQEHCCVSRAAGAGGQRAGGPRGSATLPCLHCCAPGGREGQRDGCVRWSRGKFQQHLRATRPSSRCLRRPGQGAGPDAELPRGRAHGKQREGSSHGSSPVLTDISSSLPLTHPAFPRPQWHEEVTGRQPAETVRY